MNSFPDEEGLLESYQLYIMAKYKASDCSKTRPDMQNMFSLLQVYEIGKISFLAIFDYTW